MIRVTVWNEFQHEKSDMVVQKHYPKGIHNAIADFLKTNEDIVVTTAHLDMPEHGLPDEVLDNTDVLIWWGHIAHHKVSDEVVQKVCDRILMGMGAIFLHSAHHSKPFKKILGTSGNLTWRESGESLRLWCVDPTHPINEGLSMHLDIDEEETYGEYFDIPTPDELVYISWYSGGDVFRSGCTWKRGCGKIFYFQPGHETYPIYHNEQVQKIITNAVRWAKPIRRMDKLECIHAPVSLEDQKKVK